MVYENKDCCCRLGMRENPSDVFVNIAESPSGKSQRTQDLSD